MMNGRYRFKLGEFECLIVLDGYHTYPQFAKKRFSNAPRQPLEQLLGRYRLRLESDYVSPYPVLVVNTGETRVLIDTGAGRVFSETGRLVFNLASENIAPEDIDIVILTHGHPDHIGGIVDRNGKLAFPNARYVMWKDEWEFWVPEPDASRLMHEEPVKQILISCARDNLPRIRSRLELVDRETEIITGVRAVAAPGHTPGHMAVTVCSNGERLLCVSDAVLHPVNIYQPDWASEYECHPDQVATTRRELFRRAADENALVHAFHFPWPGLGHLKPKGGAWQWQPIEITG